MLEAQLYKKLANNKVYCELCNHYCHLNDKQVGVCGVRKNLSGKLVSLNYGKLISASIDPIEKKPIYHFLPGSLSYSIATVGCNFRCDNCQNWQISQLPNIKSLDLDFSRDFPGDDTSPEQVVKAALNNNCQSISYTYTEPTIFFEFALDCMKLAKEKKLKNIWVSNGYMSDKCLNEIIPYLDAINVDLKFYDNDIYLKYCGAKIEPIKKNLKKIYKKNVHLEITTLLIPGLTNIKGQPKGIAEFIAQELSQDVPWHLSKFSSDISYRLQQFQSTPLELIDQAYQIGKEAGLKYIYVGNIWGDLRQNTYCPSCQQLLIERSGYNIKIINKTNYCSNCRMNIPLIY